MGRMRAPQGLRRLPTAALVTALATIVAAVVAATGGATPSAATPEFSTAMSAGSSPCDITAGPDGNLWFTEGAGIASGASPRSAR